MELHFAVRLLIVGIALSYFLAPMLWHWREANYRPGKPRPNLGAASFLTKKPRRLGRGFVQ
jgi:hypothetical protein